MASDNSIPCGWPGCASAADIRRGYTCRPTAKRDPRGDAPACDRHAGSTLAAPPPEPCPDPDMHGELYLYDWRANAEEVELRIAPKRGPGVRRNGYTSVDVKRSKQAKLLAEMADGIRTHVEGKFGRSDGRNPTPPNEDPDLWPWVADPPTEPGFYWLRTRAGTDQDPRLGYPAGDPVIAMVERDGRGLVVWHHSSMEDTVACFARTHEWIARPVAPLIARKS